MFVLIENGAVKQYPYGIGELKKANPNTSFSAQISDVSLEDFGVYRVYFDTQPTISPTQVLEEDMPVFATDAQRWTQVWRVRDMTIEEVGQLTTSKAMEVRFERTQKLFESDWTQLLDAVVDQTVWAVYRQSLRDITKQNGFPFEVVWPEQPR